MPDLYAPCYGKGDLFNSTDIHDHHDAAELCDGCPMFDACNELRPPFGEGTWAGVLYVSGKRVNHLDQEAS